jgi:hypothetical protein
VSASFETEVRVCPGVEYDLRFGWRNPRTIAMDDCDLTFFVGDSQVFYTRDWDHVNWRYINEIEVPSFRAGQSGVRQTRTPHSSSSDLYVKFRGVLTCQPWSEITPGSWYFRRTLKPFWTTFVLDSFSLTPRAR